MPRPSIIGIILCALCLSECKKPTTEHTVPYARVNLDINLNLPQYNDLNYIGGYVYLEGGYNGILAYRVDQEKINAYDRQAPYRVQDGCQVFVESSGVSCIDTCSGSSWLLQDGQVMEGPASNPLKQYTTHFDGLTLTIRN
ncbi:MAG: hypothetical protein Kow0075_15610 [Salibacteraceae bacterium]